LEHSDRLDFISEEAGRLGADLVGYVTVGDWEGRAGYMTPGEIWPATRLVVVLAIAKTGCVDENTECSILNGMAYRLAVWLSGKGIASVFLPCGGNAGGRFSHEIAAGLAGLFKCGFAEIRPVSVLTSYDDV
jgi:hypothetical protein